MGQAEQAIQERDFLTIQNVSQYLIVKTSTLYAMVEERSIPHYRVGKLIRFKKAEIDQWMEGNRKECVDSKKVARKALRPARRSKLEVDRIIRKAIDGVKREGYTKSNGKPDQVKGLGKEVPDGTL